MTMELDLQSRPVQQGDFLFELIAADSDWQLELNVDEQLLQYLPEVSGATPNPVPVRFRFLAEPDVNLSASLWEIQDSIVHEDGRSSCQAFATVSAESVSATQKHRQPGTAVSARILCGRRAAGFVVFREFAEFIREKAFLWL